MFFAPRKINWLLINISLHLSACGAPLRNADSNTPTFANVRSISAKVESLCTNLELNDAEPNLSGMLFAEDICSDPVGNAQELQSIRKDAEQIGFSNVHVSLEALDADKKVLNINTRSEFWLNQTNLNVISKLLPLLNGKNKSADDDGKKDQYTIKMLTGPHYDESEMQLSFTLNFSSSRQQSGSLKLDNDFEVVLKIFERQLVSATVKSTADAEYKQSVMHSGKFLLLFIPQANDVYLSLMSHINMHSFGADDLVEREILQTLGNGIAKVMTQLKD